MHLTDPITLQRKNAPDWVFQWSDVYKCHAYTTNRRTTYLILTDEYKPFWIGRVLPQEPNEVAVIVTDEHRLRAVRLIFSNGGEYYFPQPVN